MGWEEAKPISEVPLEFIFETGDAGAGELDEQLGKERKFGILRLRRGSWRFENKAPGTGALQAADLAAYETAKQLATANNRR